MEKFAVDLDKVLDEFEFNEDRAEQMATILAKRNNSSISPIVGGHLLHQSPSACFRRPAFEPINLADADFAADPQISAPHYNNGFSSATNSSPGPPPEGNVFLTHSENINKNEIRARKDNIGNDCQNSDLNWQQDVTSAFHNNSRIDVSTFDQRNLPQNSNYSEHMQNQGNLAHPSQNSDYLWQQDVIQNRLESSNKLNVSGVFSSLNEYLNAGNIESKVDDSNILKNRTSWNPSCHRVELEENGNYAFSHSETSVGNTVSNIEHQSPSLTHKNNAELENEAKKLGVINVDQNFQQDKLKEEVKFSGDDWSSTIDVCKVSENSSLNSYADLIPISYSKSRQEENISNQKANSELNSSDETPDLLDSSIISNRVGNSNFTSSQNQSIQANKGNGNELGTMFSSELASEMDLQNYPSKDFSQSNLALLPDVASSGRSMVQVPRIDANVTSDLVTSHGTIKCSDNENVLDLISHESSDTAFAVQFPIEENSHSARLPKSAECQETHAKDDSSVNESVTSQSEDASISKADFKLHETHLEDNEDKIPHEVPLVGFNALDELDDAELNQYLEELEHIDIAYETEHNKNKLNTGGTSSLVEQKNFISSSEADARKQNILKRHISKEHGEGSEISESNSNTKGRVSEIAVEGESKNHGKNYFDVNMTSIDSNLQITCFLNNTQCNTSAITSDGKTSVEENLSENTVDMPSVPGYTLGSNQRTAPILSVTCSTVTDHDKCTGTVEAVESESSVPIDPSGPSMPNISSVSKTSSAITNLVSIDCHQINNVSNEYHEQIRSDTELCKNNDRGYKTEENSDKGQALQSKSPDSLMSQSKSLDSVRTVSDLEKMESSLTSVKNDSSSTMNNVSSSQDTNFDSAENGLSTPEIYLSSNETSFCDKSPQVILPDCERTATHPSIVDSKTIHSDVKNNDSYDTSKTVTKNVNEVEYSEVQSCLVRMPKDGSTINVLGEEERPSRPKYLFLPSKITVENEQEDSENSEESPPISGVVGPPGETPSADARMGCTEADDNIPLSSPDISESSSIEQALSPITSLQIATPLSDDLSDILSPEERSLGKLPPFWVPDADAPNCMLCDVKFTVLKRRHHCRACGKVLCSKCCSLKSRLEYMDNSEARVCQPCYTILAKIFLVEQGESASGSPSSLNEGMASGNNAPLGRQPNPNNPMEYCSTIPPLEQAASVLRQPPPSVLVPVGVLKREGSTRSRSDVAKQVIFSDGIRPGGDLTELDGSSEPRLPYRRPGRVLKRVGTPPGPPATSNHSNQRLLPPLDTKTMSYIPAIGLPPLAVISKGEIKFEDVVDHDKQMVALRSESEPPAVFAINRNLFVHIKILNLDCCVNRTCWCFTTSGMSCVGQDEIMVILECLPDETTIPKDIFRHLNTLYQDASRGNTVSELGHTVFQGVPFLNSSEHGGFIYIRPSFQCLQKLIIPPSPYLVAILVHRWETPWATVFPIRLMLRLGAEYRYYPCMLVSIRNRRPVYWEIGHTIINLLADFRNLSYTLPSVRGLVIHMEDRQTSILLPKNRYDQVIRALNNSNDHVLALASNFSFQADSHLVCIQSNRDESYHTQAINIHNKPRKVTGASFVVFNGALKVSSNLTAKSSIVEDGLMVQITPDTMQALRAALRNMQDFSVGCGPAGASQPDELVNLKWVQDDKNFNVGVKSSIDGRPLDGVPSIRVHNGTDYMGSCRFIRWTEVFILQSDEGSGRRGDPLDISRLSESLARATCLALIKLLDLLAQAGLTKLAVRATVHPENVGYEAGSKGEKLPPIYMDSLDNELVPVLHKAASMLQDSSAAILELIFHVMLQ